MAVAAMIGVALLAVRLPHLGPDINEPHAWRQMDTAHYIRAFAEDPRGVDVLRPSVAWMGNSKTLILEFPLPEAIAAWILKALGADSTNLLIPRLVFFAFFIAAVAGFFLIAKDLAGPAIGLWASLFYLASPLSQAYSRAVHIDFSVLAFVHFACLFLLRGIQRESIPLIFAGAMTATVAALIKGPYLLPALAMLVPCAFKAGRRAFLGRAAALLSVPALAFTAWRLYAEAVNGRAPDWGFIPEYHRFTDMGGWYFGSLQQRLRLSSWTTVIGTTLPAVAGLAIVPFLVLGAVNLIRRERGDAAKRCLAAWLGGSLLYVLLFFNLNVVHDYYQLPLVAPLSLLAALGVASSLQGRRRRAVVMALAVLAFAVNVAWAETHYYRPMGATAQAGRLARAHTQKGALLVTSWPSADPRSPHLLFSAHRYGWAVRSTFLTQEILDQLRDLGATHLALLQPHGDSAVVESLRVAGRRTFSITDAAGQSYRFDLATLTDTVRP